MLNCVIIAGFVEVRDRHICDLVLGSIAPGKVSNCDVVRFHLIDIGQDEFGIVGFRNRSVVKGFVEAHDSEEGSLESPIHAIVMRVNEIDHREPKLILLLGCDDPLVEDGIGDYSQFMGTIPVTYLFGIERVGFGRVIPTVYLGILNEFVRKLDGAKLLRDNGPLTVDEGRPCPVSRAVV